MKLYPTQISTEDLMCNSRTSRRNLSRRMVMKTKDRDTSNKKHDNSGYNIKSWGYTYSSRPA